MKTFQIVALFALVAAAAAFAPGEFASKTSLSFRAVGWNEI